MLQPNISETMDRATPVSAESSLAQISSIDVFAPALNSPVAQLAKISNYAKGAHVFMQDDEATHAFQVLSGFVCLYQLTADGRRQVVEFLSEGQFFGFGQDTYNCFAEALSDSVIAAYSLGELEDLASQKPEVSAWLLGQARLKMQTAQQHVVLLARSRAVSRLATFICQWLGDEKPDLVEENCVHLPMTRKDMADYLGMSFETVSRAFSELKRFGVISLPTAYDVIVHDTGRLADIAEGLSPEESGRAWAA